MQKLIFGGNGTPYCYGIQDYVSFEINIGRKVSNCELFRRFNYLQNNSQIIHNRKTETGPFPEPPPQKPSRRLVAKIQPDMISGYD